MCVCACFSLSLLVRLYREVLVVRAAVFVRSLISNHEALCVISQGVFVSLFWLGGRAGRSGLGLRRTWLSGRAGRSGLGLRRTWLDGSTGCGGLSLTGTHRWMCVSQW